MNRFAHCAWVALAILAAFPAHAQTRGLNMLCADRNVIVGTLTDRFGEQVQSMGLANQNRIVEVYVSAETGSWTITVTSADGTTCLMAAGQHFAQMPPAVPGEDL
ncbi:hypothetical protein [Jannaschia sp. CCS1]|uniref:hypothetical protein n=1 Tax=Jannaschia sp. (strain CCS1) TaxID=290400 RepID=UPI00006BFFA1|nr:hypothetical protein [Jannaschia sp. CCS1]ABD53734.1 hypothetical protein Jann_0817 [Jannaschia sp. CCS1]